MVTKSVTKGLLALAFAGTFCLMCHLAGCVSSGEFTLGEYDALPSLVKYSSFEFPMSGRFMRQEEKIRLRTHIDREGNVDNVILIQDLGDAACNDAVLRGVKGWKYTPAVRKGQPEPVWIEQTVKVRFTDLKRLTLSIIRVATESLADSLWQLLNAGKDFSEIAKVFSLDTSASAGGFLGEVEVQQLEMQVYNAVSRLSVGELTEPISTSRGFAIYKRLSKTH